MLWVTLLATIAVALAEVEIITSPTPGNEYVHISGAPQDGTNSTDPRKVLVSDEGLSGLQQKHYQTKKVDHRPPKKDNLGVKVTIKDEGLSGAVKKTSGIGVPPLKHMDDLKYDVVGHKSSKWEGGLDFDDDVPLSDKKLKPSASQASRVNVKKGPNGQEYEYEYVYYYYDEDEDEPTATPAHAQAAPTPARGQHSNVDRPTTSRRPSPEAPEEPRVRGELVKQKNVESEPLRSRSDSADHRGGHRVVEVSDVDDEQHHRRRTETRTDDRSSNRYTTIERGASGGRGRDAVPVTTAEPSANEVLPARGAQRGRQVESAVIEDDRLPANTRFPSRGRGASVVTTIPPQPAPTQSQPSRSRTQGNGATIRRPSLVDSSSFRTHANDPAPDAGFDRNYYRSSPLDNTRESDLEEYVQPELVRPTTFIPSLTTLPPSPAPLPEQPELSMPDKAALDLYAIIQQQQEENSVSGLGVDGSFPPTELVTTPEPTTVVTTTTTTPAPTTTTTTTTTTPPPPAAGRGRFRGAAPGGRTRPRLGASTTTTTTETPHEEETPRRKFSPSSSGRLPGQVSTYGRRGAGARASTTTAAPAQEQETSSTRTRASIAGNSNRYRARGRTTVGPSSHEDESSTEASVSTTTSRPTRPRLNVSAATRPLRPGPRINLRGRPGISTTAATSIAQPEEEEPTVSSTSPPPPPVAEEEASSPTPTAPVDALSRLRNRPRLKVQPRQPGSSAPTAAAPRPPPVGFKRPGRPLSQQQTSAAPEEPAQAPTEAAPTQTEAPADPAPTEPPSPVPPHLARRRPAIRRLQIPHHQQ